MKPAYESAVTTRARPGVRRSAHRPSGAVLVLVLAAALAALLPNAAQANEYGPAGLGGARINITPDGYNEGFYVRGREYQVQGTGFLAGNVHIFQCAVSETDSLFEDCQELGVGVAVGGNFGPTPVYMRQTFSSVNNPPPVRIDTFGTEIGGVNCWSHIGVQCAVVAAQFDPLATPAIVPLRQAEHYICFEGNNRGPGQYQTKCEDQPLTTTTTM